LRDCGANAQPLQGYASHQKNLIAKGERAEYKGQEGKRAKGNTKSSRRRGEENPKANVEVLISRVAPVANGSTTVPSIAVPRTAAQQVVTRSQAMCHNF